MKKETLYTDKYIDIYDDYFLLKGYYFLKFGTKKINFIDIESIKEIRLVIFNGLTRHEHVWLTPRFPFDWKVENRKEGILLKLKNSNIKIGIATENTKEVSLILLKKLF